MEFDKDYVKYQVHFQGANPATGFFYLLENMVIIRISYGLPRFGT
jgi:hypothetical protein